MQTKKLKIYVYALDLIEQYKWPTGERLYTNKYHAFVAHEPHLHYPSLVKFKGRVRVKICLVITIANVIAFLHNQKRFLVQKPLFS